MDKLFPIFVAALIMVLGGFFYQALSDCHSQHGRLVSGVVWFVCVEGK